MAHISVVIPVYRAEDCLDELYRRLTAALAPLTLPYGADVEDFTATVGMKCKVSEKMILRAKLGYFDSRNTTSGGRASYHGPVGYVSIDHAL